MSTIKYIEGKRKADDSTVESFENLVNELKADDLQSFLPLAQERGLNLLKEGWDDYRSPYIRILDSDETLGRVEAGRASWSKSINPLIEPDTLNIYRGDLLGDYMAEFAHQVEHNPLGMSDAEILQHRQKLDDSRRLFRKNTYEFAKEHGMSKKESRELWEDIAYGHTASIDGKLTEVYTVWRRTEDTNRLIKESIPFDEMTESDWELRDLAKQELWDSYNSEFYTHSIIEPKLWDDYFSAVRLNPEELYEALHEKHGRKATDRAFSILDSIMDKREQIKATVDSLNILFEE